MLFELAVVWLHDCIFVHSEVILSIITLIENIYILLNSFYPLSVLIKYKLTVVYFLVEHGQQHVVVWREQLMDPGPLKQCAEDLQQLGNNNNNNNTTLEKRTFETFRKSKIQSHGSGLLQLIITLSLSYINKYCNGTG